MKIAKYVLPALVVPGLLFAQHLCHPVMVSRDDAFSGPPKLHAFPDTLRILAVMVQFQPDNDIRTTGNGQFDLSSPKDSILDAPPRNRQYFLDHLKFLENYYRKTSRGKTVVRSTVVDSLFTLSGPMSTYSPPKNGSNLPVANLARDTWQKVDSSGRVPDFSIYNCFVVFHAGVGRDIDLVGTLGYDPGPLDIPSLYLGLNAFREFYGSAYEGIPVAGGKFKITNTIVMPETESRTLPTATGNVLLQYSINGLLCSSLGNYLGLPDLFDTNTGQSGIGRFGLMDGQAIFSFNGLFPPEPSAWEKYWLGWVTPITVPPGATTLSLPAVGLGVSDPSRGDTIYRVPISSQEYFLLENRNRDPLRNGQTVHSTFNGVSRQQFFRRDTTGFESGDLSKISGVVTDVEDFDWSLPGGVDQDGTFFDGGVLIWHIDESVIADNIGKNQVNANPLRRGVDLEEADGSQDIGQAYGFLSAGSGSEEGTALDFWFEGNSSPVFKNEFSTTTFPGTSTNGGADSHVKMSGFTLRGPRMSVAVERGDKVSPLRAVPRQTGEAITYEMLTVADGGPANGQMMITATSGFAVPRYTTSGRIDSPVPEGGKIFALSTATGEGLRPFRSTGVAAIAGSSGFGFVSGPVVRDLNGDGVPEIVVGQVYMPLLSSGSLRAFSLRDANTDSLADPFFSVSLSRRITSTPVIGDSIIAVGTSGGMTYFFRLDGTRIDSLRALQDSSSDVTGVSRFEGANTFIVTGADGTVRITSRLTSGGTSGPDVTRNIGKRIDWPGVTGGFRKPGSTQTESLIAVRTIDGSLYLLDAQLQTVQGFPVHPGEGVSAPAIADVDGDGNRDIVLFTNSRIWVYNRGGISLDYFPITIKNTLSLQSSPVVADVDGDGLVDIVAVSQDGIVVAYNKTGSMARGFPLLAGVGSQSVAVATRTDSVIVMTASGDGSVSGWVTARTNGTPQAANYPWPQYQHDAQRSGMAVSPLAPTPPGGDFFPRSRAYNWPNPVYDGRTYIRYFVKENAVVRIKVFDVAGDLVTEFTGPGIGGIDNEVEWNAASVQSGVYFARIEATGTSEKGVAIVKVAVVK